MFAISASNIPYYAYFAKNINSSVFNWFGYANTTAGMVVGESMYWTYIVLFLVATLVYVGAMIMLRRFFDRRIGRAEVEPLTAKTVLKRLVLTLCLGGLCAFGIRGRVGYNPIKISEAYYCQDPFLNWMAENV